MGQRVAALMLGMRLDTRTRGRFLHESEDFLWEILPTGRLVLPAYGETDDSVGYVIAAHGSTCPGEGRLDRMTVLLTPSGIAAAFPREIKVAMGRWTKFVGWLKVHRVRTPSASLLLTSVERP